MYEQARYKKAKSKNLLKYIEEFLFKEPKFTEIVKQMRDFLRLNIKSNENHQIIHLFKIIKILHKFKIFQYHRIGKFINIIDLRKLDFLSAEK